MIHPLIIATRTLHSLCERYAEIGGAVPDQWKGEPIETLVTEVRLAEAKQRNFCDDIVYDMLFGTAPASQPTPLQAYFLACRCRCAIDTIGILAAPNSNADVPMNLFEQLPGGWSDNALLHWLLSDSWTARHDTWLKLIAVGIATGNPYYSG